MLKKLRLKFVGSAMGAIALVLLAIVGGINLRNYIQITENADRTLQIIADNGGRFPYRFPISERPLEEEAKIQKSDKASGSSGESGEGTENAVDKDDRKGHLMPSGMSPETPYETRFFTVVLSEKGEILSTDLDRIAAVDCGAAVGGRGLRQAGELCQRAQLRKAIGASARLYRSRLCRLYLLGLRGPKNRGSSGNRT